MKKRDKTKKHLIDELAEIRQRVAEWEASKTKHQQIEEALQQSNNLLNALNTIQSRFITDADPQVFFDNLLSNLLSLTQSEYGFIGEVLHRPDGKPYLKTHAITNISWNKATRDFFEKNAPTGLEFYNLDTLFGEVIKTGKPVISVNPSQDPRSRGLPQGHPKLHTFLGLPFYVSDQLIGMAGIANRPGGYDKEIIKYLHPYTNACGNIIGAYRNEQRRTQAEEELQRREEQFRSLVETAVSVIICLSPDHKICEFNPEAERLYGRKREEVLGKDYCELFLSQEVRDAVEADMEKVLAGEPTRGFENPVKAYDGSERILVWNASRLLDSAGQPIGIIAIGQDITDRKRVEEIIRYEKEFSESLINSSIDGILALDHNFCLTVWNPGMERITSLKRAEVVGKCVFDLFPFLKEIGEDRFLSEALAGKTIVSKDRPYALPRTGQQGFFDGHYTPLRTDAGEIIGMLAIIRDITERKKMEEEALRTQKLESIGILAGGIAHDFNNILTAILGSISLAKMYTNPGEKTYESLTDSERASLRARDLTKQLLTFSQGGTPIKKTTSIVELIEESAIFALTGSNVRCEFSIPDDLWVVEIDEGQMSQVINNLIINAQQAMPEGGTIKVYAQNTTASPEGFLPLNDGKYIQISIKDQGIGISEDHLPKIFDPYFTTKNKGSGLGLATSYAIIKKHDGTITVESKLGIGSTFTIYLPASQKEIPVKKDIEERLFTGKGKVLVLEDEKIVRDVAGDMLTHIGYHVDFAEDGAEAIALYEQARKSCLPFDVVIMDLTIPGGMGGKEAIQKLREIDPEIKAIVSSGYSDDPVMIEFRQYGFSAVIAKPYKIQELSKALHTVITGSDKCNPVSKHNSSNSA